MPDNIHHLPTRLPPRPRSAPMRPPRYLPAEEPALSETPSPVVGYLLGIALLLLGIGYLAGLYTVMKWMA